MKLFYTFLFLSGLACLFSCKKDKNDVDIKTYDNQQIQAYIAANNLTGMQRDLTGGDTTGIYYQILTKGTGDPLAYSTPVSLVYTIRSLDGSYSVTDTIMNHSYAYVGSLTPPGLQLAVNTIMKNKGTRARLLIPSRLAFGTNGSGTGSTRLTGNQSLDYYVNVINSQSAYDDIAIRNYATANNIDLTTFTKTTNGVYYKITKAGTGTDAISKYSTVYLQYSGYLLNGTLFDQYNDQGTGAANTGTAFLLLTLTNPSGWIEPLTHTTAGAKLTVLVPSAYAYGTSTHSGSESATVTAPANSCVRYDMNVISVTNP